MAHLRRAVERAPALLDANQVVTFSLDLSRALLEQGKLADAAAQIAKVQAATPAAKLDQTDAFFALRALVEDHERRFGEAAADAARARALQHDDHQDEIPDAAFADLALGEAKLGLHAPDLAVAPLDHALAIAEKGFDPFFLAELRAARAKATVR